MRAEWTTEVQRSRPSGVLRPNRLPKSPAAVLKAASTRNRKRGRILRCCHTLTRSFPRGQQSAFNADNLSYRRFQERRVGYGARQTKFAASSMLPVPLYLATCGYGHRGRVRSTLPSILCDAINWSGALPCSTHCSSALTLSNTLGPSPPPQWPIPGSRNSRTLSDALPAPPTVSSTLL